MALSPVKNGEVIAERYVVERVLGSGGMGVVVSALHRTLGERVAIKLLYEHCAEQPKVVERFLREARAAARLRSEHVVRVTDVGVLDRGIPYLIMEFLDGNDVASELAQRGPLPVAEAVDYFLQACEALAEAHGAGIVHRDLKPANLFLASLPGGYRIIKIIDFGIAKSEESATSLTATSGTIGSPMYMSPEQIRNPRTVDQRGDVWSLGVTCYELLTGRLPFNGESVHGTLASIVVDRPVPLQRARPDLPAELEQALFPCFEKNRKRRYANVAELARALLPFAGSKAEERITRIETVLGAASARVDAEPELGGEPTLDVPITAVSDPGTVGEWTRTPAAPRRKLRGLVLVPLVLGGVVGALAVSSGAFFGREASPLRLAAGFPKLVVPAPEPVPAPRPTPIASPPEPALAVTKQRRPDAPVARVRHAPKQPRSEAPESKPEPAADVPVLIEERKF